MINTPYTLTTLTICTEIKRRKNYIHHQVVLINFFVLLPLYKLLHWWPSIMKGIIHARVKFHFCTNVHQSMKLTNACGQFLCWAYRMSFDSFWCLHAILLPHINTAIEDYIRHKKKGGRRGGKYVLPPIHKGELTTSVCLACAIRYFAVGSPYDIAVLFGTSYSIVLSCV